ncbi:Hypothetical predicted protein, partial [Podarcis lilfordi]
MQGTLRKQREPSAGLPCLAESCAQPSACRQLSASSGSLAQGSRCLRGGVRSLATLGSVRPAFGMQATLRKQQEPSAGLPRLAERCAPPLAC